MAEQESTLAEPVREAKGHGGIPLSAGMMLVALGVVYGDIGTSPMYTMKSVIAHNGGISQVTSDTIIGALSLIIWTLTLVTTIKYVVIAMKADNHNEGGIFALYALVRRVAKWLIIPAMIGGASLLADGVLTPVVTVTEAIEGLRSISWGMTLVGTGSGRVVLMGIVIISALFLVQRAGTSSIGKAFGPIMTVWFLFLGIAGIVNLTAYPGVLLAFNPVRGIQFLFSPVNKSGIMVLNFVFLATTGAEALYSDMGHVGKANIYGSWPIVKACVILNYLGQGAWLITNQGNADVAALETLNPFFQMLPEALRPFAVLLSACAAIIASQALITGSFTLVSEATRLDLLPHVKVNYPSEKKGQIYIPIVNNLMWAACICMMLYFRESSRMEAAYSLAITITMLMTSVLITSFIAGIWKRRGAAALYAVVFGAIETCFFLGCLTQFLNGGIVMVILSALLFGVMYVWRRGTAIERTQTVFLPVDKYVDQLGELRGDDAEPYLADNLVFLTNDSSFDRLDRDILYSILDKRPKRAKAYWFLNVQVTEEPHTLTYAVNDFGTNYLFKVQLRLGFRVNQRVNQYLYQIVSDLMQSGQLPPQDHKYSIYRQHAPVGDFRFCLIRKMISPSTDLSTADLNVMTLKYFIRRLCGSPVKWFGLENSSVLVEFVPLFTKQKHTHTLTRVFARRDVVSSVASHVGSLAPTMGLANASDLEEHQEHQIEEDDDEDIFTMGMSEQRKEETELVGTIIGGDDATFRPQLDDEEDDE